MFFSFKLLATVVLDENCSKYFTFEFFHLKVYTHRLNRHYESSVLYRTFKDNHAWDIEHKFTSNSVLYVRFVNEQTHQQTITVYFVQYLSFFRQRRRNEAEFSSRFSMWERPYWFHTRCGGGGLCNEKTVNYGTQTKR